MGKILADSWHYVVGLAAIAAACVLGVEHVVSGTDALGFVSVVTGALVGGGIATKAGNGTTS